VWCSSSTYREETTSTAATAEDHANCVAAGDSSRQCEACTALYKVVGRETFKMKMREGGGH
jgi:hypothetical protein